MTGRPPRPAEWLAQAHEDPRHARALLRTCGRVALRTGLLWDVVQVADDAGLAAVATGRVNGPALHDARQGAVRFLVSPTGGWCVRGTAYLGGGTLVCVPTPEVTGPPGPYWLTPPDGGGELTDPVALFEVLAHLTGPGADRGWCGLCGRPGPSRTLRVPGPTGPGHAVPVHGCCAPSTGVAPRGGARPPPLD
ncbi:hypothetical protein [Streptomyces roseolilacinus]|uniref:hypothetical protein n=1 Tax=Streptomyces roseolilacinus TaxID=66904 RepID=UPI0038144AAF